MDWRVKAKKLYFDEEKSWSEVAHTIRDIYFPREDILKIKERVRSYIRKTPEYKKKNTADIEGRGSIEYKNGTISSEKIIRIANETEVTPELMVELHGLDPRQWECVSYKNNYWQQQKKGGTALTLYQSKLTVKPKVDGLDLEAINEHFRKLDRTYKPPKIIYRKHDGSQMAEVNIADLHLGKLCWHGDTGNNYDYKIARDIFYRIINEVCNELQGRPLEYILFVWTNDFFNSDTINKTTTGGTPQDTDIRWQKLFDVGVEMLINAIDMLKQIAPVKTFYTPSNHDETACYYAIKYLEAWFRYDENVSIDTSATRKYILFGNVLLGFTHGKRKTKETIIFNAY